ncbi:MULTISPECIES: hypothetical protein [Streptomyces violaceusniger group]|uniref:Response regulatory domain-containing protein n=2 Tax=Streptomyces rhizosphaericus TaxID=114699 RepID=A0ABN1S4V9_9ACTN
MTDRITVQVRADDPLSEAGVISLLRPRPEIRLDDGADDPAVTVVAADISDPAGYQLLRTAQHGGSSRLVLLVSRLLDHQLALAAECGTAGIMWRRERRQRSARPHHPDRGHRRRPPPAGPPNTPAPRARPTPRK